MKKAITILLIMIFQGCFPSFAPKEKVVKEIKKEEITLTWIELTGTLDQNFTDYISIQKGKQIDTLLKAHNIADLKMKGNSIIIGFYGQPQKHKKTIIIPDESLGYKILVDTSFVFK
jgi:PBP1b-binding outer membrane lipoprotein LpoB